jgi:hypothetical protein
MIPTPHGPQVQAQASCQVHSSPAGQCRRGGEVLPGLSQEVQLGRDSQGVGRAPATLPLNVVGRTGAV